MAIDLGLMDSGQWTSQAKDLYDLLILTFSNDANGLADLTKLQTGAALSLTEWEDLLQYTSQVCSITLSRFLSVVYRTLQVLSNLVNFKTFGFTKIVPRIPSEKFEAVVSHSANSTKALPLWKTVSHHCHKYSALLSSFHAVESAHLRYRPGIQPLHRQAKYRTYLQLLSW